MSAVNDYIHILPNISAAGVFYRCGAILLADNLVVGPSSIDPDEHSALRRNFWRADIESRALSPRQKRRHLDGVEDAILGAGLLADELRRFPEDRRVVLWTGGLWRELLAFWWALDALHRHGFSPARFDVAQPPLGRFADERWEFSLGCIPDNQLVEIFGKRTTLGASRARAGRSLWRKYATSSGAFDSARRKGSRHFPNLAPIAETHGWFFPRVDTRRGRVRLSVIDQLIFGVMRTGRWIPPIACMKDRALFHFLLAIGDEFILCRLREWAEHCPNSPALLARPAPGVSRFTDVAYRLTPLGVRLRDEGLDSVREAPPLAVGGGVAYGGNNPWIRYDDGAHWRLERLAP
jgi:hypothetical protein